MREILFRAWDEQQKTMHNNFQFIKSGEDDNDWILFVSDKQPISDYEGWRQNPYFRHQFHIMQFTGFKDKNGKDKFKADIVKSQNGRIWEIKRGHYKMAMPGTKINLYGWYMQDGECQQPIDLGGEIIGNIHENPELLTWGGGHGHIKRIY